MAWWTKVRDKVERHDGPRPKLAAAIRLNFEINGGEVPAEECGLYKRDPVKHPDAENLLPGEMAKARARRAIGGGR